MGGIREIGKGINAHTVSLHGHLTKKKQDEVYKKLLDTQRGLVCIMTPYFLGCIPTSTSLIIIHNSASSEYQSVMGPYINFVSLIENFARIAGIECMFSDTLLPLTTTARVTNESLVSWYAHASYRSQHNSVFHSLDHTFSKNIIHPDILEATKQKIQEGKNIAFFVPRIGYASLTKCNDCQHVMACTHCDAPLRLHRTITTHYTCSRCSTSIPPIDFCQTCGGSRLALLGISVGKIIEALGEHIDQDSIIPVTAETIHKKKNMVHIDQIMQKNQGACYVGTTALLNLPYQFDTMVIVSAAHLFAHTEYSSYEESLRLGMQLREHTLHDFFIQTPAQYTTLVSTYWHMPIQEQLSYEDALRKEYHLPPYLHKAHIICSPKGAELLKKLISTSVHMLASYQPKILTRMPYHGYRGGLCVEISFAHRSDLKKLIETLQGLKEYVYVLEK